MALAAGPVNRQAQSASRPNALLFTTGGDCGIRIGPSPVPLWSSSPPVHVIVRDNNVDQALRVLKKKMQREGIFREMKLRRNYEKPSEQRVREKAEAVRRHRKLLRKRMEREGF